jgi:hypothetical protein
LEECFSPYLLSKSPNPKRDGALKKKRKKRKEKEKLQESLQIKRGGQYIERRKIFQLQNLFT